MVIIATVAMLAAGGVGATENKRDESKTIAQNGVGQAKESSVTFAEDSSVTEHQQYSLF